MAAFPRYTERRERIMRERGIKSTSEKLKALRHKWQPLLERLKLA